MNFTQLLPSAALVRHGAAGVVLSRKAGCCVVCGTSLRPSSGVKPDHPTCGASACRFVVSRRSQMDEANFVRYLQAQVQMRQDARARVRRDQAVQAANEREQDAVWATVQSQLDGAAAQASVRLVVPSGPARRAKLAQRRLTAYRHHLEAVVSEAAACAGAVASVDPLAKAASGSSPIQQHLCGLCRGGCCTQGGDRAYLTVDTVRRVMRQQPQWSPADLVQAYMDRVAPRTERESCINHTKDGCSLPREMRSDVCNNYACASLSTLQKLSGEAAHRYPVIVIRRRLGPWTRALNGADNGITAIALLTDEGVRRLPLKLASAAKGACAEGEA
jgi:hypothetical protein